MGYFKNFFIIFIVSFSSCATPSQKRSPDVQAPEKSAQEVPVAQEKQADARQFIDPKTHPGLQAWCKELSGKLKKWRWDLSPCRIKRFQVGGKSIEGRELVYLDFGPLDADNTTLVFTMVHGDEVTPLYVGIKLTEWLETHLQKFPSTRVVVAPLVNPDGFFHYPQTRTNARGVDVNRNFATQDWKEKAIQSWKRRYRAIARRNPGKEANSEPETHFQKMLIDQVKPDKILSIHAPLNFIDYDGPNVLALSKFSREYVKKCIQLKTSLKAVSGGYFPGSLGNFAGRERGIPTITLELPTANPAKASRYWNQFLAGIQQVIEFRVPRQQLVVQDDAP